MNMIIFATIDYIDEIGTFRFQLQRRTHSIAECFFEGSIRDPIQTFIFTKNEILTQAKHI